MYIIKDENPPHYKSRFCVKDFSQYYNINNEEIYASIIKSETLCVLFSVIIHHKYQIHEMDAIIAFLNNILKETIYVK